MILMVNKLCTQKESNEMQFVRLLLLKIKLLLNHNCLIQQKNRDDQRNVLF